jgi:hypothetical protein
MHPILVAALAEDEHRRCPCGAVAQLPYRLCRGCHVKQVTDVAAWECSTMYCQRARSGT